MISDLKEDLKLQEGMRFRDKDLYLAKKQIAKSLVNNGFPFEKIDYDLRVSADNNLVDISFTIDCGGFYKFGKVKISENNKTSTSYIKREIAFKKNDTFDQRKLEQTQQQIMNLGVFQFVTVKAVLDEIPEDQIPVEIIVKEAPRYNVKFGFGYGLEDRFRVSADLQKIGFFRSIDRLNLLLKHSGIEPYHLNLKLTQPLIFSRKNKIVSSIFLKKQEASAYSIKRYGGSTKIHRQLAVFTNCFTGYTYERNFLKADENILDEENIQDITEYNKSNILFGLSFNNAEPALSPNRGLSISTIATLAGVGFS